MRVPVRAGAHVPAASDVATTQSSWFDACRRLLPGLGLVLVLGLVAQGLAAVQQVSLGRIWLEALVIALLLGVLVRNVGVDVPRVEPGATYAAKQALEFAVLLLGVSVDAGRCRGCPVEPPRRSPPMIRARQSAQCSFQTCGRTPTI